MASQPPPQAQQPQSTANKPTPNEQPKQQKFSQDSTPQTNANANLSGQPQVKSLGN